MYTMLVVDDNPADRSGICSLINQSNLGIEIVETCSNGKHALEVADRKGVDIVLTDVAMPVMDGIALARRLKDAHPRTRVVFMSCHSDFEYAQSAVNLDIHGYVLKPIVPAELLDAVRGVLADLGQEAETQAEKERMVSQIHDMLPMVQEQFLRELLLGNCFLPDDIARRMQFLKSGLTTHGCIYVLSLVLEELDTRTRNMSVEDQYFVSYTVKKTILGYAGSNRALYPVQLSGREYSVIVSLGAVENPDDIVDLAVDLHNGIQSSVGLSATIGISKASGEVTNAHELYRQSVDAVNTQFYGGSNPIIRYDLVEGEQLTPISPGPNAGELCREIRDLVMTGSEEADAAAIERYLQPRGGVLPAGHVKSVAYTIVNMLAIVVTEWGYSFADVVGEETQIWEKLNAMKSVGSVRAWLLDLLKRLREHFADRNHSRGFKVVEKVTQIIKDHYHEQIGVDFICSSVALSQSYANSLVKKETGKSIFDHLQEYRLEVAKRLLMNRDSRVSEVAESVGYENKSYFALMFKKHVGVPPSEFRARFAP